MKVIRPHRRRDTKADSRATLHKIGEQLGVETYLLQGSVQRSAETSSALAHQLASIPATRNNSGPILMTRDLSDVLRFKVRSLNGSSGQLSAAISPQEIARIEEKPAQDMAAFDLYLRAKS